MKNFGFVLTSVLPVRQCVSLCKVNVLNEHFPNARHESCIIHTH